jgi:hypothetical protein
MANYKPIPLDTAFGRLTVIGPSAKVNRSGMHYQCRCECGTEKAVAGIHLRSGHTSSCGCHKGRLTHGATRTTEYRIWANMRSRCSNPNLGAVSGNYIGRGISVCERWSSSFVNFLADMGPRPSPRHTLDRIDNDGNYEPGNCRWATADVQRRNSRLAVYLEHDGRRLCITDWAAALGVSPNRIRSRLKRGKSVAEALSP